MILACRPWDLDDLDPERRKIWDAVEKETGLVPPIYPGSIKSACQECGMAVSLGPRQQQQRFELPMRGVQVAIMCLLCATRAVAEAGSGDVFDLGNPYERKKGT